MATDYIVETEIVRTLADQDVHDLGKKLDDAMRDLATGTLCRDDATLAYLSIVESMFYTVGWRHMEHDALVLPALDHIVTGYPDDRGVDRASLEALSVARTWIEPSSDYHDLIGGVINCLKGRMSAVETRSGWVAFYPRTTFASELRSRWFAMRIHASHEAAGANILERNAEVAPVVGRLDAWVESQNAEMHSGIFSPPPDDWYVSHIANIADRTLQAQFAPVRTFERIAGLSKAETIAAIRPLFLRAARIVFGHVRAFKYLRERLGAPAPVLLSCIDVVPKDDLAAEVAASAKISGTAALKFVNSLVRSGREEKFGIRAYPLVPINANRLVMLPSTILFGAWPLLRERAEARSGGARVGDTRDTRHIDRLQASFRAAGFQHVFTDVVIEEPGVRTLTDLDVAVVDPATGDVLVVQVKSFIPPSNLLDVERATDDVRDADRQCDVAAAHPALTKQAIEARLGAPLPRLQLHQMIAVEAIVGMYEPKVPAVSIEWLESELAARPKASFVELLEAARTLPDATQFSNSVSPAFQVFRNGLGPRSMPQRCAVFAYGADRALARNPTAGETTRR